MSNSIAKLIEVLSTQKLTFPGETSPFVTNILERMLTKDPMQRIGWLEIFMLKINSDGSLVNNNEKHILSLEDAQKSEETNKAPGLSSGIEPSDPPALTSGSSRNIGNSQSQK
jgi:serine/threonine protein kinase